MTMRIVVIAALSLGPFPALAQADPSPFENRCFSCPVGSFILQQSSAIATQAWDISAPAFAAGIGVYFACYLMYWLIRVQLSKLPAMSGDQFDASSIYRVTFRVIMAESIIGAGFAANNWGFQLMKTLFIDVLVYGPIQIAGDLIQRQTLITLSAKSAMLCNGGDMLSCVLSSTEDSLSWIVVAAYKSLQASFNLNFFGGGFFNSTTSISPLVWLFSLYLLYVSGKSLITIPIGILTYAVSAYGFVAFTGLLIALWVWTIFPRIIPGSFAIMVEHGCFFIALAVVAVLLPSIATEILRQVNISYTSLQAFYDLIENRQVDLVPWRLEFWLLLFFVQAISEFVSGAKQLANRVYSLLGGA